MTTVLPMDSRVESALTHMIGLEESVAQKKGAWEAAASGDDQALEIVAEATEMATRHIGSLLERLGRSSPGGVASASIEWPGAILGPASGVLAELYTVLSGVLIRYSVMQPMTHRFRDSGVIAESGTTAHLTRAHMQDYMTIVGRVTEQLHNSVIRELDGAGSPCNCTCPSCGFGLCVCSVASRSILSDAWNAAKPSKAETGLHVLLPRTGSAADRAGFHRGDVVVVIDGQPVTGTSVIQKTIRDHEPNARIDFVVKRHGDLVKLTGERWSDLGVDADQVLDTCVVPAGQEFFVEKAREEKEKLAERLAGDTPLMSGLASLTPREIQVLRLAASGASNPLIAEDLEISRATVARHIANILEKLGAANRAEAASLATASGLVANM